MRRLAFATYAASILAAVATIVCLFFWVTNEGGWEAWASTGVTVTGWLFSVSGGLRIRAEGRRQPPPKPEQPCGNRPVDLRSQRLVIAEAFSSYFVALMERESVFIEIPNQIRAFSTNTQLRIDSIAAASAELLNPKGPRAMVIAAHGGMGKTCLTVRILRCLSEWDSADVILGDSAKRTAYDVSYGRLTNTHTTMRDTLEHIATQLGYPYDSVKEQRRKDLTEWIRGRVDGRRSVILLDDLDSLADRSTAWESIEPLLGRDCRAIITTRTIDGLPTARYPLLVVNLEPIVAARELWTFCNWHIHTFGANSSKLTDLSADLNEKHLKALSAKSGGVPLVVQLLLAKVALSGGWSCLSEEPNLYGNELLDFLYGQAWQDLDAMSSAGKDALLCLVQICQMQQAGKPITFESLRHQRSLATVEDLDMALRLLMERFLVVGGVGGSDHLGVFPSMIAFCLAHQRTT